MIAWTIDALTAYMIFLSFGMNLDFITTTLITHSSVLFGTISFLPAGIGLTEVSFVNLLNIYGVDISLSTSVIIMIRLLSTWFPTSLGFIFTRAYVVKK